MTQDEQHLKLLSIFHYVVGGMAGLFGTFPILHVIAGIFFIVAPEEIWNKGGPQAPPPAFFGWMFVIFGSIAILLGWTLAALLITAGRFLARRKHYMFCFVTAAIECLWIPFGTILGVFTIVVLIRESVKQLFADAASVPAQPAQE
jgi:hypothetical protein